MRSGGCDDPDCICGGRGAGDEEHSVLQTSSCGTVQLKSILDCLEMMEEEVGSLKEKISDFRAAHRVHEERCINDDIVTTNKINSMNEKVLEIRQLVGVDALSKGVDADIHFNKLTKLLFPGLASFKLINEMRRNATIDESGFMVPIDDQPIIDGKNKVAIISDEASSKKVIRSPKRTNQSSDRIKSPKKTVNPGSRKESTHVKANDPKHNWKILSETIGFTNETSEEKNSSSRSSDSLEENLENRGPKPRRSRSPRKKK